METLTEPKSELAASLISAPANHAPADTKQLRVEYVGKLLEAGYQRASTLKLKRDEWQALREDFPDEDVEVRAHDGMIYISHMLLRERLWSVFHPGEVAEICRDKMLRTDTNEIAVDLVLMIRGVVVSEAIGSAKYYPNNPKGSYSDTVESAWSEALRRCCKRWGVGTQVWRPAYIRDFKARGAVAKDKLATERQEKREEKSGFEAKVRQYKLEPRRETAEPEIERDDTY
jgi:hypothetical protein